MRHLLAFLLATSACSGDAPRPATPIGNDTRAEPVATATTGTGEVRLLLAGEFPDLRFPLTVSYPGGTSQVVDGRAHGITVPASDDELTRIEIEGWRPIWVRVPIGGSVSLSTHPCCGITFDSNTYDDAIASCTDDTGMCPAGRVEVPHSLAEDAVCGDRERCVPHTTLRVVQARAGGASNIVDEGGDVYRASADPSAPADIAHPNIADMFSFQVDGSEVRQDVGMDRGASYTIFLDGTEVTRVRATKL